MIDLISYNNLIYSIIDLSDSMQSPRCSKPRCKLGTPSESPYLEVIPVRML